MRFPRLSALVLSLVSALAACGDGDAPPAPVDAGMDASVEGDASTASDGSTRTDAATGDDASMSGDAATGDDASVSEDAATGVDASVSADAATGDDAATGVDASVSDDAGLTMDMCIPPRCPPIPAGCTLEPSSNPCECGIIKCEDAGPGGGMGDACGGRAGPCGPALFCNFTVDFDCGFADGMGVCEPRPEVCSFLYAPVCGCDNVTYSNGCVAQSMGTDIQYDGECGPVVPPPPPPPPPPTDCRDTGCRMGATCMGCRTVDGLVYACIPRGAAC
jgi:hypothetical protein